MYHGRLRLKKKLLRSANRNPLITHPYSDLPYKVWQIAFATPYLAGGIVHTHVLSPWTPYTIVPWHDSVARATPSLELMFPQ